VTECFPFIHCMHFPSVTDGSALVLLHGTGGDHEALLPLARQIAPNAALLAARGRCDDAGATRWFRRTNNGKPELHSLRAEAAAFKRFVKSAVQSYNLDPARLTFLGYSNGAVFTGALMALYPALVNKAILLRVMPAFQPMPSVDLSATRVLMVNGATDPLGQHAPHFEDWLHRCKARCETRLVYAGHQLVDGDLEAAQSWMSGAERPQLARSGVPST